MQALTDSEKSPFLIIAFVLGREKKSFFRSRRSIAQMQTPKIEAKRYNGRKCPFLSGQSASVVALH
jgi:hypothetical protein